MASLLARFWQPDELVRLSGVDELDEALGFSLAAISSNGTPYGGFNEPLANLQERALAATGADAQPNSQRRELLGCNQRPSFSDRPAAKHYHQYRESKPSCIFQSDSS